MTATAIIVTALVGLLLIVILGSRSRSHGIDLDVATEEDIPRLLQNGHKIAAIKLYRRLRGVGLKEAKEAVERLAAQIPPSPRP